MRAGRAWVALLMVPLLAGCVGGDDGLPPVAGVPTADLAAGNFYAFHHGGGPLVFTLDGDGDASFDLYDGVDQRLGSVGFSSETTRSGLHRIAGVAAGDLVLRLLTLNGTLRVESDGHGILAFQPLTTLVERQVLVDRAPRSNAFGPFGIEGAPLPGQEPADLEVVVTLQRVPADLRLLATGPWTNLSVEVRSDRGVVLRAPNDGGFSPAGVDVGGSRLLEALPGQLTPQNIRNGALSASIHADDLGGALVLEAHSYSRAPLPARGPAGPDVTDVAFTYGQLPDTPVAFIVHPGATRLVLWQEGPTADNASVALFDATDGKLAVVQVPRAGTVQVAVAAGGEYVAILHGGKATLGADRAPADFELRPLEVSEVVVPAARAGQNGRYAVASEDLTAATAYAFRPALLPSASSALGQAQTPFGNCYAGRFLRVDQGGEAILVAFEPGRGQAVDATPFLAASRALRAGPLTVVHDGFGDDGCERQAVAVLSYVRA